MEVREATQADAETIRDIASRSMHASYESFLDAEVIDQAIAEWYDHEELHDQLDDDNVILLVAEDGGEVVGFSQSELLARESVDGRITWLHVDPDARDRGIGSRLLVRTQEELLDHGAERISSAVLAGNEFGNEFYDGHGYEMVGDRVVEIGESEFRENVWRKVDGEEVPEWETLDPFETEDGTVYVSYSEAARGSQGPFYQAYSDDDRDRKYGWFCGACQSFENAMSTMGEVVCNECGNRRKPTRWDAAYL
ncbi:GNAT family N-acetyltransferase [Haloarchaeobius amylolyticus]|uniref:GNAT family N-acetyltransferase n=1 Tax=Haloarchaeobius amylolyticus TaxID=1198296 RepID=UPI00227078EA|nr:GNAT family N-acetyltransferase [Haloarchaeobius amylolyticus]